MSTLNQKIDHAFDESHMLILGVHVLIGFQFASVFQGPFNNLPVWSQYLKLGALGLLLFALAWMMAPASFHGVAARGEDTVAVHQFTTRSVAVALLPFSLGIAIEFFIAGLRTQGAVLGLVLGLAALASTLFAWYGLELMICAWRPRRKGYTQMPNSEPAAGTPLSEKIDNVLMEARMVLPGVQALLGFQLAIMFIADFDKLPDWVKYVHLAGLVAVGVSMVLLIMPAAYHRIVESGEDSEPFHRFASRAVLAAMAFLAVGIAADFLVVVEKVSGSIGWAIAGAAGVLLLYYGLWFGYAWIKRSRRNAGAFN